MTDSATTRKRMRKQSLGSNTNTWGDTKLNEVLDVLDQISDGYETIALTGNITLTTTNYTTADQAKYRLIRFTGGAGPFVVTFPSVEGWAFIKNDTSGVVTVKMSGGTGVAIPTLRNSLVWGDATDLYSMAPNWQGTSVTLTNSGDLPTYSQIQTLIANASLPASAGTLLISGTDTTAGYAGAKITAKADCLLTTAILNSGANEQQQFSDRRTLRRAMFIGQV